MTYKQLVKRMTKSETMEYLKGHPMYRLPKKGEVDCEDLHFRMQSDISMSLRSETNFGFVHDLFKLDVVLIKKDIKNLKNTGIVYHVELNSVGGSLIFIGRENILKGIESHKVNYDNSLDEILALIKENDILNITFKDSATDYI